MTKRELPTLDAFRLAAALLVVAIHTAPLASVSQPLDLWLTRIVARVAVPYFFMVTGYFLARKGWRGMGRFWRRTLALYGLATALYLPLNLYAGTGAAAWLRGFLWEGTFYHLWYFPALLWGSLLAWGLVRLGIKPALAAAGLLYLVGLGGDSYFGLARQVPALETLYDAIFSVTEYTRDGLFFAPLFLLLGAALAGGTLHLSLRTALAGLAVSLGAMTAEGFWLHGLGAPRHDSMYLGLPLCMVFLFEVLLSCNRGRWRAARDVSLLVYLLHPGCIVAVRAIAKLTHTWSFLVENSVGHFAAVVLLSLTAACLLARLRPQPLPPDTRAWKELDETALQANARVLQEAAGPGSRLMAVVKADAYGHGAVPVARSLQKAGIREFAVACLAEGIALRKGGVRGTILILGWTDPAQAPLLHRWRLTQAVASLEHGRALAAQGCPVQVHLAVDTGMHRLGLPAEDRAQWESLFRLPGLRITGVFSHLCVSDDLSAAGEAFTRRQAERFAAVVQGLRSDGLRPGTVHLLASYGIWNYPEYHFDMVRAGIALYGVRSDGAPVRTALPLRPVLALKARVALVRRVAAGETAGYGRAFTAKRPTRLAVLAVGYGDGLPRSLPAAGGRVLLHGVSCPMVGRMCMDQLLVDVTDAPDVQTGEVATLIGRDGEQAISVEEVARRCGTISNEFLSRLGPRLGLRVIPARPER